LANGFAPFSPAPPSKNRSLAQVRSEVAGLAPKIALLFRASSGSFQNPSARRDFGSIPFA
jgi:hypothetical protein